MSHVVNIETRQRCVACGGTIEAGPMHTSARTTETTVETMCYHDNHCPVCTARGATPPE